MSLMRKKTGILAILAAAALWGAPQAFAQFNCATPPDVGKTAVALRGALLNGALGLGDYATCGSAATCRFRNRVYTTKESRCINAQQGVAPDYIPGIFGMAPNINYEGDPIAPANWAADFGSNGEIWVQIFDIVDPDPGVAPACLGYYAVGSEVHNAPLPVGVFGNQRTSPCTCTAVGGTCAAQNCWNPQRAVDIDACSLQMNTPIPVDNHGGVSPVPIPTVVGVTNPSDLAAPGNMVSLHWAAACPGTSHDGAPAPILGYVVEGYVDADGNGSCTPPPATCDPGSATWKPILEVAPSDSNAADALPFRAGDAATTDVQVEIVSLSLVSAAPISSWECIGFRNRLLFIDDRTAAAGPGGKDGIVNPVVSVPSGPGPLVANSALPALISDFAGRFTGGNIVDLSWQVGNDSFTLFRVSKSDSASGPFQSVGEVRGEPGRVDYGLTDSTARSGGAGRGNAIWYRLEATGPGISEVATVAVPVEKGKH